MTARLLSLGLLLPLAVSRLGCINPFAPKLDTMLGSSLCTDLTDIENVLCTFRNAYSFKDTTLYGTIIDPSFTFVYRDYERGVDVSWGRDDEMRTTYGLFQNVESLTLIWNNEIPLIVTDTLRTIQRAFNLTVTFNPSNIDRVDGNAVLTFARAGAGEAWKIVYWRDESNY